MSSNKNIYDFNLKNKINSIFIPGLSKSLEDINAVKNIDIVLNKIANIDLQFNFVLSDSLKFRLRQEILSFLPENIEANINFDSRILPYKVKETLKRIPNIKNIIAIASGKGGVGKSTVCINLALALSKLGAAVGILDADIYGPSIPSMLGIEPKDIPKFSGQLYPVEKHHIPTMSLGYLVDNDNPAIWRGPMASGALQQLLQHTKWPQLDYLLIDLPPGTGDIQLTLSQKLPLTAVAIITTPQIVAANIAAKSLVMFKKLNIPILGIVENMGYSVCTNCGQEEHIFGNKGGEKLSADHKVDLLGKLPLDYKISLDADKGLPYFLTVDESKCNPMKQAYIDIATNLSMKLSSLEKDNTVSIGTKIIN